MANNPGKFRGPSIQPVGAGRSTAQKPGGSSTSKKLQSQLTDLERNKLEGDPLTLLGRSDDPLVWGEDPAAPQVSNNYQSRGDRLIFRQDVAENERIGIGVDDPSELWFLCHRGIFRWVMAGASDGRVSPADAVMGLYRNGAANLPRLQIGSDVGGVVLPKSTLHVRGTLSTEPLGISGNYTADEQGSLHVCDASGGGFTVTLPAVADCLGRIYAFKRTNSGANTVIVDASGAETIDGALTKTLGSQYACLAIQAGSSEWHVISTFGTVT